MGWRSGKSAACNYEEGTIAASADLLPMWNAMVPSRFPSFQKCFQLRRDEQKRRQREQ